MWTKKLLFSLEYIELWLFNRAPYSDFIMNPYITRCWLVIPDNPPGSQFPRLFGRQIRRFLLLVQVGG